MNRIRVRPSLRTLLASAGVFTFATSCLRHKAPAPPIAYRTHAVSQALYPQRVRDQINLDSLEAEASALRFRFRSKIMRKRLGDDEVLTREANAVPLGIESTPTGRALSVLTTRCVVDFRYPLDRKMPKWSNLALFSVASLERRDVATQVFALLNPNLPGTTGDYDPKRDAWIFTSREYLNGPLGDRYFDILKKRRVPRATARLPVGYWSNSSGIDLAVLQLPLSDPGVAALVPTRNLGIQNSVQVIRTAMEGRQHLWGDTFQFDLISRECMKAVRDDHQRLEREAKLWRALAIAGAISFAWPLLNSPAATEGLSDMLLGSVKKAARDTAWSTLKQLLTGQQITDITWDDFGRLVLRHASQDPRLSQILLAGVSRLGLSDEQAAAILADVRQALGAQDASVSVMTRPNGPPTASVFLKNRGIELAADLLRTGRVRLDLNDLAALGQQLGLLQAARSALADPSTSTELVADVGYRGALTRVAEQLEAP